MAEYLDRSGLAYFWLKIKSKIPGVKYDTTANWNAAVGYIPPIGEIIIYEDYMVEGDQNIPNFKVGDGSTYVQDLPFTASISQEVLDHINNNLIHVSSEDRNNWNHKIDCYDEVIGEELILYR